MSSTSAQSKSATNLNTGEAPNGLGRLIADPQPKMLPEHDIPPDGYAICALFDESLSFITHECVVHASGLEGTRVFVGYHDWQLYASARVMDLGWIAGTVNLDQSYLPNGNYYN